MIIHYIDCNSAIFATLVCVRIEENRENQKFVIISKEMGQIKIVEFFSAFTSIVPEFFVALTEFFICLTFLHSTSNKDKNPALLANLIEAAGLWFCQQSMSCHAHICK